MNIHQCVFKILENQTTSGPVNAHLTPGLGIYFDAFIHVYTNVDVNRKPLSLCQFVASFKTISLKSDFIHVFQRQQKGHFLLPICRKLQNDLFEI